MICQKLNSGYRLFKKHVPKRFDLLERSLNAFTIFKNQGQELPSKFADRLLETEF